MFILAVSTWSVTEAWVAALKLGMRLDMAFSLAVHRLAILAGSAVARALPAIGSTVGSALVGLALGLWLRRRDQLRQGA